MPLERGLLAHEHRSSPITLSPKLRTFKQFTQSRVDKWHWPMVLLMVAFLTLLTQAVIHRDAAMARLWERKDMQPSNMSPTADAQMAMPTEQRRQQQDPQQAAVEAVSKREQKVPGGASGSTAAGQHVVVKQSINIEQPHLRFEQAASKAAAEQRQQQPAVGSKVTQAGQEQSTEQAHMQQQSAVTKPALVAGQQQQQQQQEVAAAKQQQQQQQVAASKGQQATLAAAWEQPTTSAAAAKEQPAATAAANQHLAATAAAAKEQPTASVTTASGPEQAGAIPQVLHDQLAGCRTLKTDPIPNVDLHASRKVLESYTAEQRQRAEKFTAAVAACDSFACLQQANKLPRAPGQFQYPQFFVVGFPKCATTSIYCHLIQHPQVQYPTEKELHVLTKQCDKSLYNCTADTQRHYLVDVLNLQQAAQSNFTKAAFEGSTHYVLEASWLAEQLAATFPWLKVVISMRDPISQAIAMIFHNLYHARFPRCFRDNGERIYECAKQSLQGKARYAPKLATWMQHFPRERLHLVQFENITAPATMRGEMHGLKAFLGVDTRLPSLELPLTNYKHQRNSAKKFGASWDMTKREYQDLVALARKDMQEVVELMMHYGLADKAVADSWMQNWEAVWQRNLDERCERGNCRIEVS